MFYGSRRPHRSHASTAGGRWDGHFYPDLGGVWKANELRGPRWSSRGAGASWGVLAPWRAKGANGVLVTLWWALRRFLWFLRPMPRATQARDRLLADRAATTLRRHMRAAGTIRSCDPYSSPMELDCDHPKAARLGIERARAVLSRHSLPGHVLNALLRQIDPNVKAQASAQPEYQPPATTTPVDGSIPKSGTP